MYETLKIKFYKKTLKSPEEGRRHFLLNKNAPNKALEHIPSINTTIKRL